ncbi:hypothetical protein ACJMK2_003836 [Sinanodonta woodiana]|uniref:Secreted protein n=1 Tax=Sinanodonta woodiana TaxID=1069815 RepID=A0ABD3Y2D8_SINWO
MKVLLFFGILAIVKASAPYDRLLQRLRETQDRQDGDHKDNDANLSDWQKQLEYRVGVLEDKMTDLGNTLLTLKNENGDQSGGSEQVQDTHTGEDAVNRGSKNNDQTRGLSVLLEKIKSIMDETKQEQIGDIAKKMRVIQEP